ncbi:protein of unknown function [Bradyrhizobium vignae]|uniref:Uncharacterized protein n=1 Tax=Bradyrhizobium vignae TaxID=1549949 RepID=A0A2U3Q6R3_9BRAD|nr:protein of unknown function [Bradyrhizobium vignae]
MLELNVWRRRDSPPARMAIPRPRRLVPIIEPVICAWTTEAWPFARTNRASTSSATLPKLTMTSPRMVGPACLASCSVPRRIHSASTAMEPALATNVVRTGACMYLRPIEIGIRTSKDVKTIDGFSVSIVFALLDIEALSGAPRMEEDVRRDTFIRRCKDLLLCYALGSP